VLVRLDEFWIARTTVTVEQYHCFDPWKRPPLAQGARLPMTGATWYEATLFCRWLDHHGAVLRERVLGATRARDWHFELPTEARWEYACRGAPGLPGGGQNGYARFVVGDQVRDLERIGWHSGNSGKTLHQVATTPEASPSHGLWDMLGNCWEWTSTEYHRQLGRDPEGPTSPTGPRGTHRVLRGGCYWNVARDCRAAYRNPRRPDGFNVVVGFRPVLGLRTRLAR
jgi:formylglycine-generating enzyme required for sulfatase activity